MIQKTDSWKATDGNVFATLALAQAHDIEAILAGAQYDGTPLTEARAAAQIVENKEKVLDILTTTATSKPKARKINGGSKKRKPVEPAVLGNPPDAYLPRLSADIRK